MLETSADFSHTAFLSKERVVNSMCAACCLPDQLDADLLDEEVVVASAESPIARDGDKQDILDRPHIYER